MRRSIRCSALLLGLLPWSVAGCHDSVEPALAVRFADATTDLLENGASIQVQLELIAIEGPLEESLAVEVRPMAVTGVPDEDLVWTASPVLVFPAGSLHGSRRSFVLQPADDELVENLERIDLDLVVLSTDAAAAAPARHIVHVHDDDGVDAALLSVTTPDGFALDAGDQIAIGAAAPARLTLANAGSQALEIGPLTISDAAERSIDVLLAPDVDSESNVELLLESPAGLGPARVAARELAAPLGVGAELWIDGQPAGPLSDYTTELRIFAAAGNAPSDGELFVAQTSAGRHGWQASNEHGAGTVWRASGTRELPRTEALWPDDPRLARAGTLCAEGRLTEGWNLRPSESVLLGLQSAPRAQLSTLATNGATLPTIRLAIETDYGFASRFQDVDAASSYALGLVAALDCLFSTQVHARLELVYLGLWTTPDDPWTAPDAFGNSTDLLFEFQAAWSPTTGNGWPVDADLAHFLSGSSLFGGAAFVDALCDLERGFGVSSELEAIVDWESFPDQPKTMLWDFIVAAHELGHSFGALHSHDYCAPLDRCAESCDGVQDCGPGSLMSYCHLCGGGLGAIELSFHPYIANLLRGRLGQSCAGRLQLAPGASLDFDFVRSVEPAELPVESRSSFAHTAGNAAQPFSTTLLIQNWGSL